MGRRRRLRSQTLPSSPTRSFSSSSSSDFEFIVCTSPHNNKSSCPADDLFYKGKLLPLHLSPRLSMVRTLLLASSSTSSSSDTTTSASRDSSGSSSSSDAVMMFADYNCDSSRPSSVAELEDEFLNNAAPSHSQTANNESVKKSTKYFSLAKFSSVFKKEPRSISATATDPNTASKSVKRMSASARDVFRKYMKKVKPLYEKLSHSPKQQPKSYGSAKPSAAKDKGVISHSFSGNLNYPRRKGVASSCPSSMRSSPCHSGVLTRTGCVVSSADSSMEELQSAIQGAIAHCKNSMLLNKSSPLVSQRCLARKRAYFGILDHQPSFGTSKNQDESFRARKDTRKSFSERENHAES